MTPTQPSHAVETFEEWLDRHRDSTVAAVFHEIMLRYEALRAELARPQEVAAPVTVAEFDGACAAAGLELSVHEPGRADGIPEGGWYECITPKELCAFADYIAASRVPVALPALDLSARLTRASNSILTGRADLNDSNACAIAAEIFATTAPKQGDAKDADRYRYMIDCDFQAGRKYLPTLNEADYKAKLRAKHDAAILASKATAAGEGK